MIMLALYNFLPLYCLSCGTPTRLDRADNPIVASSRQGMRYHARYAV